MDYEDWTPERVTAARESLGMTQDELAVALRVKNARTIRKWEKGESDVAGPATVALEYFFGLRRPLAKPGQLYPK